MGYSISSVQPRCSPLLGYFAAKGFEPGAGHLFSATTQHIMQRTSLFRPSASRDEGDTQVLDPQDAPDQSKAATPPVGQPEPSPSSPPASGPAAPRRYGPARGAQTPNGTSGPTLIQRIKDKLPMLEYAKRFVPNMKTSPSNRNEHFGKCPSTGHDDSRASFCVNSSMQVFQCLGCGIKGNVVGLYALMNNMAEDDAKFALGRELGVVNERRMDDAESMLSRVAGRYAWQLERKLDVVDYLVQERGLTHATIQKFGLGYCWGTEHKDATPEQRKLAVETGLARQPDENAPDAPLRSFMSGRITFPVKDRSGRIVGFAGRLAPSSRSSGPKYLNTPETKWFHKSELLYGANEANSGIARTGYAAVVEGYMDVIGLHQAGVDNAVAVMGASANEATFQNLWSMTSRVVFCLDGDAAGDAGALRSALAAATTMVDGCEIAIARLPAGVDPDEFVLKEGADAWLRLCDEAMPLARFLMVARSADHDLTYPEGRARFLDDAQGVAGNFVKAPLVREQIIGEARALAAANLVEVALQFSKVPENVTAHELRDAIALMTRHAQTLEGRHSTATPVQGAPGTPVAPARQMRPR